MNVKPAWLCTFLLVASLGQAAEPPIVISTGKSGGGYNTIGERLKSVLAEQDRPTQVLTSAGSLENLSRLDDPQSPVNIGLTQADALKYYLKDHPGFADRFINLGEIGKECVFIVTGKDSEIRSDSDLQQAKGRLIAVQSPNSGVAVTWEYMTVLEPAFRNTAPAFVDGAEALLQIKSGGKASKIQAAMVVQRPTAKSTEMQVVLENPRDFRLVPVKDWDLNDKLPDGSAVSRGLMLANKTKLTADQRTRLSKVMLLAASRVVGDTAK